MPNEISRRALLAGSLGAVGVGALRPLARAAADRQAEPGTNQPANAMAPTYGEYTVIDDHYAAIPMASGKIVTDAPSLVKTSDGALLCAVPIHLWGTPKTPVQPLAFFRSDDDGRTWSKLPAESEFCCGIVFPHGKSLYFLGAGPGHRAEAEGMGIIRSDDDGQTWTDPVTLFKGPFYQPAGGYVIRDGQFYWCCDTGRDTTYVIAGDLSRDLTDPEAWRISEPAPMPSVPAAMTRARSRNQILEGNVVEVNGRLQVSWRCLIGDRDTVGMGAIYDLDDDGTRLDYRFRQFHPLPGGQGQFYILRDETSGLYWMNATLPTRSQEQDPAFNRQLQQNPRYNGTPGNERRILALYCSFDALNWLPAGYIVIWPLVRQASNYCGLLIDGDDLLVAARTSRNGQNQHDNDLTTFHRVKNFRKRAAALMPPKE